MTTDNPDIYSKFEGTEGFLESDRLPVSGAEKRITPTPPNMKISKDGDASMESPVNMLKSQEGITDPLKNSKKKHIEQKITVNEAEGDVNIAGNDIVENHHHNKPFFSDRASISNVEKIETVNFITDDNSIKYNMCKQEMAEDEDNGVDSFDSFRNPTIKLTKDPSNFPVFHSAEDLEDIESEWKKNRVILLGGVSEEVLSSTAYQLMERAEFDAHEKRLLTFDGVNMKYSDCSFEIFLKFPKIQKMIILVDIKDQCNFLDSFFKTMFNSQSIKEKLEEKEILIICILDARLIKTLEDKKNSARFFFTYRKIDFLPHFLKKYFPGNSDELEQKILEQRRNGLWGNKDSAYDFYKKVKDILERGRDNFEKHVEKGTAYDPATDETHDNVHREVEAQDIFEDEEPNKTVIFIGAFFSRLSSGDFDRLVRVLLKGKTKTLKRKKTIRSDDGQINMIETEEEVCAVDIWNKKPDSIINDCKLKAVSTEYPCCYIDFFYPYLKKDMANYFKEKCHLYMRQQFLLIRDSGIFFAPDISYSILENITHLAVQMAMLNPPHYNNKWLQKFILPILEGDNIADRDAIHPFLDLSRFFKEKKDIEFQKQFCIRISKLLSEMLHHQQLDEVVNTFLDNLFTSGAYESILHIVERIFPSQCSRFDAFYWFKRLVDQGEAGIKKEVYKIIHKIAANHSSIIFQVLESVHEWVPPLDRRWNNFTPSNKFALRFIIHYCSGTVMTLEERWGTWPSKYPLFQNSNKDETERLKRLEKVIQWLMHPLIDKAIEEINSIARPTAPSADFHFHAYITFLLEEWGLILVGKSLEHAPPEAMGFLAAIIKMVILNADTMLQRKIMFWLAKKNILYRMLFTGKSVQETAEKEINSIRYDLVHLLFLLSKQILNSSDEVDV